MFKHFVPSEKYKIGMRNCAAILNSVDLDILKNLEYDINQIGPEPEELSMWATDNLTDKERFILITAALATLYTEIELRSKKAENNELC